MAQSVRHLVNVRDLSVSEIKALMEAAAGIKAMLDRPREARKLRRLLEGRFGCVLFYQPSTRTRFSFGAAMALLGMQGVHSEAAGTFSSAAKGESIEDTALVLDGYHGAVIILRHPETGSVARAAAVSTVPIINAGDGTGEHPTQALLDLFTILEARKNRKPGTVTLVGDLKNGRTVHSLVELMLRLHGTKQGFARRVILVSPPSLTLPGLLLNKLRTKGIDYAEDRGFTEATLRQSDVVYTTRAQREHGGDVSEEDLLAYQLTAERAQLLPKDGIIMHPLPRRDELPVAVDQNPRARYFEQAHNGVPVRMAILLFLLHPRGLAALE